MFKTKPFVIVLVSSVLVNSCSHHANYAPIMPSHQRTISSASTDESVKPKPRASKKTAKLLIVPPPKPNILSKPANPSAIEAGAKYYVVQQNDTLYSIGLRFGHGYQRLAHWNELMPSYHIEVGQKLKLFNPRQHNPPKQQQKTATIVENIRSSSQKKSDISIDNAKVLKLNWQWPIKGKVVKKFSQSNNKGIDIRGQIGQEVEAAESGKVVYSGKGLLGYGNLLIIKHNDLYLSAYANNNRLHVTEGQTVKKGQVIAEVGKAGAKHAALHFEIRKNGKSVNPLIYLP
jgi:lipoprotein NlpD